MKKGTLYAFGCSHTAGQSLCKDIDEETLQKFYYQVKTKNYDNFSSIPDKRRENIVKSNWFPMLPKIDFPENSYAAHLAKMLNLKYKNFALSGTGIDTVYEQFYKNVHKIN